MCDNVSDSLDCSGIKEMCGIAGPFNKYSYIIFSELFYDLNWTKKKMGWNNLVINGALGHFLIFFLFSFRAHPNHVVLVDFCQLSK